MSTKLIPSDTASARALYRRLWRAGHASVLYSKPAIYYVRQRIREGFDEYHEERDPIILQDLFERCNNTINFLKIASKRGGIEHGIIYTLCEMYYIKSQYEERPPQAGRRQKPHQLEANKASWDEYKRTLEMMNHTLRLCLR